MSSPSHVDEDFASDGSFSQPPDDEISTLAHQLWVERGCPNGSPDDDWFRAEAELKGKVKVLTAAG